MIYTPLLQGAIFSFSTGLNKSKIKEYCETWVKPYFTTIYKYPHSKFFFYISGLVLEEFESSLKEYADVLYEMVQRKQVELLGGLYYDTAPMLQTKKDQNDQIEKLSNLIKKKYKVRTCGIWVTPGTFDNTCIQVFKKNGGQYLLAEKAYLEFIEQNFVYGLTEELGETFPIIPYDKNILNKMKNITFVKTTIQELKSSMQKKNTPLIFLGEYHDIVDKPAYFETLAQLQEHIQELFLTEHSILPSIYETNFEKKHATFCRIRTAAYGDEENESFLRCITHRPESRLLYGKLQHVSKKIESIKNNKTLKQSVNIMLKRCQNHFPYWESKRPWGIQDLSIRQNLYKALTSIEQSLRKKQNNKNQLAFIDMNLDGEKEILFNSSTLTSLIETNYGSICLLERTVKSKLWNYLATYSPHTQPMYTPWAFREYLFSTSTNIEKEHAKMLENQFTTRPLTFPKISLHKEQTVLIFNQDSGTSKINTEIHQQSSHNKLFDTNKHTSQKFIETLSFSVEKKYSFKANDIDVEYRLRNESYKQHFIQLAIEINLSFTGDSPEFLSAEEKNSRKKIDVRKINSINTNHMCFLHYPLKEQISIETSQQATFYIAPVYGNSFLKTKSSYQYTAILAVLPIKVPPNSYTECSITLHFGSIPSIITKKAPTKSSL